MELAGGLPPVAGDAHQLQQLFLNVLINAEQALARSGRHLRVRAWAADGARQVEVELWNDGPPIPGDALPHVFEPLFTTKAGDQGTGLGLFVCRRIVGEHGGSIEAHSGAVGTAFIIRLPAIAG